MTNDSLEPDKLYVAVRADLAPGPQLAQSVHAAFEFAVDFPSITEVWRRHSNFLVVVGLRDEMQLLELANSASAYNIKHTVVREPDYGDTVTAVALEPGTKAARLCAEYPLAMKPTKCMEVFVDTDGHNSMRVRGKGVHV